LCIEVMLYKIVDGARCNDAELAMSWTQPQPMVLAPLAFAGSRSSSSMQTAARGMIAVALKLRMQLPAKSA
jgi:hypothetical protein